MAQVIVAQPLPVAAPGYDSSGAFQVDGSASGQLGQQWSEQQNPSQNAADTPTSSEEDPPAVWPLLFSFMFMFQGYGAMVGGPSHALKHVLKIPNENISSTQFAEATATFQLAKCVMRILQIAFLVFVKPHGIVNLAFLVMFIAMFVPIVCIWILNFDDLWCVYLQYILGGVAVGLFEGTFLSVISPLGKNTKTFVIMGAPLGFAVNNIVMGTFVPKFLPVVSYYVWSAACLPIGFMIFRQYAPEPTGAQGAGKGCQVFVASMARAGEWLPSMIPWMIAKFCGNFVLEDAFPLLYNVFDTDKVPFWGPESTTLVSLTHYTAWYWFPMMAIGDTLSRRAPQYIRLRTWQTRMYSILGAIFLCFVGQALNWLLIAWVDGFAVMIAFFGNGFIYGMSAKFMDTYIPSEHRYAAYNLWCFTGDLGGYAGQGGLSVYLAKQVCGGNHYEYMCTKTGVSLLAQQAMAAVAAVKQAVTGAKVEHKAVII